MKTNSVNRWMTRLLAVLLCLIMVLTLLPATEAKADGNDPVYGTDRTEQELASLWSGNSYTEYWDPRGVYQGKTMPQCRQANHSWESDRHPNVTDQEKNCSHIGIKHQICKECKCLRTIYTKAKGHWHYTWKDPYDKQDATCEVAGWKKFYCEDCGCVITEEIPALGHIWKLTSMKKATATEPGCYSYNCIREAISVNENGIHSRHYCNKLYEDYIAIKGGYSLPQLELMRNHNPQYDDRQDRLLIEWINFHDTARGLRYTNISSFDTPKFSSDEKTMTIKGGPLRDKVGRQEVAVVYAESIANCKNLDPYIDVVIDCDWKLDVYLVDFGTRTQESGGEPRRGLRNITVKGRSVNVYLVNSNIGFIDYKDPNNIYSYYYNTCDVKLSLEGFNSHIYMDGATNSALTHAGGTVHCTASVNMPFYDSNNPLNGELILDYRPNNPYYTFMLANLNSIGYINPNYTHAPALELANMTVDSLGTPKNGQVQNGILTGLSGVKLTNCTWTCDTVELNDFSILELNASTVAGSNNNRTVFNVHNRAELNLNGTVNGDVNIYGTNTLRLNDATLNGSVLAAGVSDDTYNRLESGQDEGKHYRPLGNANWAYEGAELDLLLSGKIGRAHV